VISIFSDFIDIVADEAIDADDYTIFDWPLI
jgi:hypothetical protein